MKSMDQRRYPRCFLPVDMRNNIQTQSALTLLSICSLSAGEALDAPSLITEEPEKLTVSLSARLRYESRETDGSDHSHAGTLRVRPGLNYKATDQLSFFVESEHTLALLDDYQVGTPQSSQFTPFNAGNTPISDPETNELNQLFLKYKSGEFSATIGRQRLILDQAQFIGNVGWRQNEQTLDAIKLSYAFDSAKLTYAYADQANRIFGSDASGAVKALEGDVHLFNLQYKHSDDHQSVFYAYLMDFSDQGGGFPTNASNNTFGAQTSFKTEQGDIKLELAYQMEAGDKADYDALYTAASFQKKVGNQSFFVGFERLEDGFVTPLATVHAYNGFADVFISNRLGLATSWDGITDVYVGMAGTVCDGYKLKGIVHYFGDDSLSDSYGWEADLVASKSLTSSLKATAKAAYFIGDKDSNFSTDTKQLSLQLDYSF